MIVWKSFCFSKISYFDSFLSLEAARERLVVCSLEKEKMQTVNHDCHARQQDHMASYFSFLLFIDFIQEIYINHTLQTSIMAGIPYLVLLMDDEKEGETEEERRRRRDIEGLELLMLLHRTHVANLSLQAESLNPKYHIPPENFYSIFDNDGISQEDMAANFPDVPRWNCMFRFQMKYVEMMMMSTNNT